MIITEVFGGIEPKFSATITISWWGWSGFTPMLTEIGLCERRSPIPYVDDSGRKRSNQSARAENTRDSQWPVLGGVCQEATDLWKAQRGLSPDARENLCRVAT